MLHTGEHYNTQTRNGNTKADPCIHLETCVLGPCEKKQRPVVDRGIDAEPTPGHFPSIHLYTKLLIYRSKGRYVMNILYQKRNLRAGAGSGVD